jgi:predicted peptidase
MIAFRIPAVICLGFSIFSSSALFAADAKDVFEARVYEIGDKKLNYRLMKPKDYDAAKEYPFVLFLHGAGERGDDNVAQLVHGMNDFAKDENREKYPCFVMAPQCPKDKKWVEIDWGAEKHDQPEELSETLQLVIAAMFALDQEFRLDKSRIYVTGLSMGCYGTWDLAQRFSGKIAAAAPICGGGDEKMAAKMAKLPIWAFHGDKDVVVKPARSRNMIEAIKKAGGNPKYTEYEGVAHNSWAKAYSDPELMKWLFAQKRE